MAGELVPSIKTKTQSVFPPRAQVYLQGVLKLLVATVNLPLEFKGIGPLLAVDPHGQEHIEAFLMPPLGPRAEGFHPRARLTKGSLLGDLSGDVIVTEL